MLARNRVGFTLIELIAAMTISAGILLAGRLLLEQLGDAGRRIIATQTAQDSASARQEMLRYLFRNLEVGTSDSLTFRGLDRAMIFWTWCDSAAGLRGRCKVTMTLDSTLHVTTSTDSQSTVLMHGTGEGAFRYLSDAREGGQWYRSWNGVTAPLAVGVIFGVDTTVLRIGDRG